MSLRCSISDVDLVAEDGLLVATLEGGFDVDLKLGTRASQASDVSFVGFSLVSAALGVPVLAGEHLGVVGSVPSPVRLEPGSTAQVHFDVGDQRQVTGPVSALEISKADFESLCASGLLQIVVSIENSADGNRAKPVNSPAFLPSGCPQ